MQGCGGQWVDHQGGNQHLQPLLGKGEKAETATSCRRLSALETLLDLPALCVIQSLESSWHCPRALRENKNNSERDRGAVRPACTYLSSERGAIQRVHSNVDLGV
eukprot:1151406-Pelagomonas_calceolata.AAC.2